MNLDSRRPPVTSRKFSSSAVENLILEIKNSIVDKKLAWLFENCFPNTLDTTVSYREINGKPDTFVITGDIPSMWLRDSTGQIWPYLALAKEDLNLDNLIKGVINRQAKSILIDPYANAFNDGPIGSQWENDLTDMKPELHERKWELDSLCYVIRLACGYWKKTADNSCFDHNWKKAMKLVLKTFKEQQRKKNTGPYKFQRITAWQTDTVPGGGYGNPVKPVGLIYSIFRPSDDAAIFPFLIPSNLFAAVSLEQLADIFTEVYEDKDFAGECFVLAEEIKKAVNNYAVYKHPDYGEVFCFEIDGFGNRLLMDDANIPGLLSLPYLGCTDIEDEIYKNTRKFALSNDNPYFFKGKYGEGLGSPHTLTDNIWPMSIIMRAMTSKNDEEIVQCLNMLKKTHAGKGFMHESFRKNNPEKFTRQWFAWANSLFSELIIKINEERPYILRKN